MPNRCSACCMDSGRRSLREKIIPELKSSHMPRKMACETEQNPLGVFKCQLCALTAPYSYKGQQPPDCQSVVLLEECYVLRDPFTPDKGRFLIVGSRCSMCGRLVCVGPANSLPLCRLGSPPSNINQTKSRWSQKGMRGWIQAGEGAEDTWRGLDQEK
ncbi:cysteine-rich DPF motif domain-containing protein 1 isoform X2 [Moschus berezovskii]|uniref:cysteine-rich DPF motif domain-containing protein 1 isoform X2 n=1 Tax=Moschus berezovskii TaxID=68408 RepID=UPI0024442038|nr:cysteine-rich DPF motif domain-containing protein 1 isoform X2 [Moschus berezovskii]